MFCGVGFGGADDGEIVSRGEFFEGVGSECLIMLADRVYSSDTVDIVHSCEETHRSRHMWRACFSSLGA